MKLKQALTSSPVLFPKIKGEFILDADALNQGIGANHKNKIVWKM